MYQMAPTGVKIKSIWVPSDDSGDEEESGEDLIAGGSEDEGIVEEEEADKDAAKDLLESFTAQEREEALTKMRNQFTAEELKSMKTVYRKMFIEKNNEAPQEIDDSKIDLSMLNQQQREVYDCVEKHLRE